MIVALMDHPQRQEAEVYAPNHTPAWLFEKWGGMVSETNLCKIASLIPNSARGLHK